jgi:phosphorylcholine metabolism protein LicD
VDLGAIRDKGIIPHDDDIDVDVYVDQWDKITISLGKICENPKFNYYPVAYGFKLVNTLTSSKKMIMGHK